VVSDPQSINAMLNRGTFGHGGAYGTQHWIDQKKGLTFILMVQRADFNNNDESNVRVAFQRAVTAVR
jgi:CubicO group peptidase (beta-lactamase class C family)